MSLVPAIQHLERQVAKFICSLKAATINNKSFCYCLPTWKEITDVLWEQITEGEISCPIFWIGCFKYEESLSINHIQRPTERSQLNANTASWHTKLGTFQMKIVIIFTTESFRPLQWSLQYLDSKFDQFSITLFSVAKWNRDLKETCQRMKQ